MKNPIKTMCLNRKGDFGMKTIQSIEANNKVRLLNAVIGYRRETEKIEKELKTWLKDFMGEEKVILIGEFLVTRRMQTRRDLDREMLMVTLGSLDSYEKETTYEVLNLETFHKNRGKI